MQSKIGSVLAKRAHQPMATSGVLYKDRLDHHPDVKIITDWLHCALQSILVMIRLRGCLLKKDYNQERLYILENTPEHVKFSRIVQTPTTSYPST